VAGQRQAESDPLAHGDARLEPAHRAVEGAAHAAKPVVDLPDPVQADPDVREAGVLDLASGFVGDQRPVGGQRRPDAEGAGMRDQLEEVWSGQRLTPGEEEGGDLEVREIPDEGLSFLRGQLAPVLLGVGIGIAMNAAEVARSGNIPDGDRPSLGRRLGCGRRAGNDPWALTAVAIPQPVAVRRAAAIQLADADHGFPLLTRRVAVDPAPPDAGILVQQHRDRNGFATRVRHSP
jgi:hypothetical protein